MNILSFVKKDDYSELKRSVEKADEFEYKREAKSSSAKYTLRLEGKYVNEHLAETVWHGKNYLIHFGFEYNGSKCGYGGSGFATEKLGMFDSWDDFRKWLDPILSRQIGSYEKLEVEQLCLF